MHIAEQIHVSEPGGSCTVTLCFTCVSKKGLKKGKTVWLLTMKTKRTDGIFLHPKVQIHQEVFSTFYPRTR